MPLEIALAYLADDELLEVTPMSVRLRMRLLDPHARRRDARTNAGTRRYPASRRGGDFQCTPDGAGGTICLLDHCHDLVLLSNVKTFELPHETPTVVVIGLDIQPFSRSAKSGLLFAETKI